MSLSQNLEKSPESTVLSHFSARTPSSKIILTGNSRLDLEEDVLLEGCHVHIDNGATFSVGKNTAIHNAVIRVYGQGAKLMIGKFNVFNRWTRIFCSEQIYIGDYNLFGPNVMIYDCPGHSLDWQDRRKALEAMSPMGWPGREPASRSVPLEIGSDCWVGQDAKILIAKKGLDFLRVGDRSIIAAGSVIKESVPDDALMAGIPAKFKGFVSAHPSG